MSPNFAVVAYGKDTSGRTVYMTVYMHDLHERFVAACQKRGFTPTLVQGSFMTRNGGGADASGHVHDLAGAIDYRTWDRTDKQIGFMLRWWRRDGGGAYYRTPANSGMDEHLHVTVGSDKPLHPDTQWSWNEYVAGRNALSGSHAGPDPFWRPVPIVLTPPRMSHESLPPMLTRGPEVDAAIAAIKRARGKGTRGHLLRDALRTLRRIRLLKPKQS